MPAWCRAIDVRVALAQDRLPRLGGVGAREVRAVEVNPCGRRSLSAVLRYFGRCSSRMRPRPKPSTRPRVSVSGNMMRERKRSYSRRSVCLRALRQTSRIQLGLGEAAAQRAREHAVPGARERSRRGTRTGSPPPAPAQQILAGARGLGRLPQAALVVGARARKQLQEPFALLALAGLGGVLLFALELDPTAVGEQLQGAFEVDVLGLLHELEDVPGRPGNRSSSRPFGSGRSRTRGCAPRGRDRGPRSGWAGPAQVGACGDELDEVDRIAHAIP